MLLEGDKTPYRHDTGVGSVLTKADLQSRWKDVPVNDFVVGPDFTMADEAADNYFIANGLTVIIEFPMGMNIEALG